MLNTYASPLHAAIVSAIRLRYYQHELDDDIHAAWAQGFKNVMAVLPTGGGKCLGAGTPVLMFDGSIRPVEDIKVGDLLMGPDSKPRKVRSLARGKEDLYRVTPTKGEPYVVNASHILSLKRTSERKEPKHPCQRRSGEVVNLEVREYLAKSKTWKHIHKGWRTGVEFRARPISPMIPPYMLGMWLGDGDSKGPSITTADPEIVDAVYDWAELLGMRVRVAPNSENSEILHLVERAHYGRGGAPLRKEFKKFNLFHNKHIPPAYLCNTREVRLQVLAGLLDTDGSLGHSGFDFVSKNETLASQCAYLARSLGMAAYVAKCRKTCGNNSVSGDYFRVSISGGCDAIPIRIARKKAAARQQKKSVLMTGISVEPLGEGDYYGFELDRDRLFLLGDFTVTHNTVTFGSVVAKHQGAAACIAHRQELVGQISLALAKYGIRHKLIAPDNVIKNIISLHIRKVGTNFIMPSAQVAVAGVDTLIRKGKLVKDTWLKVVTLQVHDEGHHLLAANKWGRAAKMFTHSDCKLLAVTATPERADGAGLGRHADGLIDTLIEGPTMRQLINEGYLTPYKVAIAESDVELTKDMFSASGELNERGKAQVRGSHIVGDIVKAYLQFTPGKPAIAFASDIESSQAMAQRFRDAGVPALHVDGDSPDDVRDDAVGKLESGRLLVLCNVGLFGEGFDLPIVVSVYDAAATESFPNYAQRFGRMLRLAISADLQSRWEDFTPQERHAHIAASGKPFGYYVDLVGNLVRHQGPPDRPRVWTLDRRERRGGPSAGVPLVTFCTNKNANDTGFACGQTYQRFRSCCPFCGFVPEPTSRSSPEAVDGDLTLLDEETLARLRGEVFDPDAVFYPIRSKGGGIARKLEAGHQRLVAAQLNFRDAFAWWAGELRAAGLGDGEIYKLFFVTYKTDMLSACALRDVEALNIITAGLDSVLTDSSKSRRVRPVVQ